MNTNGTTNDDVLGVLTDMLNTDIVDTIGRHLANFDAAEDKRTIQRLVVDLVAQLTDAFLVDEYAQSLPGKLGMSKSGYRMALRDARAAIEERKAEQRVKENAAKAAKVAEKIEQLQQSAAPHPYVVNDGMMQIYSVSVNDETGEETERFDPICTFTAQIVGEVRDEFDNITYKVKGTAIRGGAFTVEIDTETFGSPSKLKIVLEAAAGALDTVFAKMDQHLGPAIKLLSEGVNVERGKRYGRTGWIDGKFYLPGRTPEGVTVELPKVLPYQVDTVTNADTAVESLALLLKATPDQVSPILTSSILGPPLAAKAGLSNHRYALMYSGQTGTYKTGTMMAHMSMWGAGFQDKDNLIKWGSGATPNAIMNLATNVYNLPFLLDNYKSNTDKGEKGFVETIHAMMEGGEKLRMKGKSNELRDVRDIQAWPICTGEDMPSGDSATMARFLVVKARKRADGLPDGILVSNTKHLPQIGAMLLDWLESPEGEAAADAAGAKFGETQRKWRAFLLTFNQGMPNADRVASTLAVNQLVFESLAKHPVFGKALTPYLAAHDAGLRVLAEQMSGATTDGLEAFRFVAAVREMLSTGRAILIRHETHYNKMPPADRDRCIGWKDIGGGAFLYPGVARMMVEKIMGVTMNGMSDSAIGNQLLELGWLESFDKGRSLKTKKINGTPIKMIHLNGRALMLADDAPDHNPIDDLLAKGDAVTGMSSAEKAAPLSDDDDVVEVEL